MPLHVIDRGRYECPTVVCDHCGKPITDARDGNAEWRYEPGAHRALAVVFTHKACCAAFEEANPDGWHASELDVFLVHLMNGLKLDRKAAGRKAALLDALA